MDNTLGNSVASFTSFGLLLLGTLAVMAWVMPALMPCLVPIKLLLRPALLQARVQGGEGLDGISGSPVYSHFGETLTAFHDCAFGHQRRFINENETRISINQRVIIRKSADVTDGSKPVLKRSGTPSRSSWQSSGVARVAPTLRSWA